MLRFPEARTRQASESRVGHHYYSVCDFTDFNDFSTVKHFNYFRWSLLLNASFNNELCQ